MPRVGRIVLPNYPHHIVQRGHNRQAVFATDDDYQYYLNTLSEFKDEYNITVHAFCLMTNHVHLLLQPNDNVAGLGALMKRLSGRQTRYRNRLEGRSGTLWESRYRSSPVQQEHYLLTCMRYIELNPVRARMVKHPEEYKWSSYKHNISNETIPWINPPSKTIDLKGTHHKNPYQAFVDQGIPKEELALISGSLQRGQLTGNDRFIDEIESIMGIRVENRKRGRPRKTELK